MAKAPNRPFAITLAKELALIVSFFLPKHLEMSYLYTTFGFVIKNYPYDKARTKP